MSKAKYMIHKGEVTVTEPAVTRLQVVEYDDGTRAQEEVEVKPAKTMKMKLPPGTSIGDFPVGTPVKVDHLDPEEIKNLRKHGFVDVAESTAEKKLDAPDNPSAMNDRAAEEARLSSLDKAQSFDVEHGHAEPKSEGARKATTKGGK